MSYPYFPYEKEPRVIAMGGVTAQIWPIDEDQSLRARLICLHNPGEDVSLYRRTIDVMTSQGYEVMYYETNEVEFPDGTSKSNQLLDSVIEMCIKDMKMTNTKCGLHLMGHFICGAQALAYGVNGQHRHHIDTIIGINPLVQPQENFLKMSLKTKWNAKMNPHAIVDLHTDVSLFTRDPSWLQFLKQEQYSFTKLTNLQLKSIQEVSSILLSKKMSRQFNVRNVIIIQSIEDPLTQLSGTQQFINNNGAKSAYLLEYTKGMNNLFLEREKLFQRLITDLIAWLGEN